MSLRTRIIVINAVALALALLAGAVAVAGLWLALAPLRQAVVEERQALQFAQALRAHRADQAAALQRALAAGSGVPAGPEATDGPAAAYRAADARFDALLAQAERLTTDPQARRALAAARAADDAFDARGQEALAHRGDPAARAALEELVAPARLAADAALDRYLDQEAEAANRAEWQAARGALATAASFAAGLAAIGAAGAILSLRFSRRLLDRLAALTAGTRRVAAGDRDVRLPLPPGPGDELDQLSASFNLMVGQLAAAEAAARRADEVKAGFLASISHDLRTPLTTITGLLETLRRTDAGWDEAARREFLAVAAHEADRLARLVANLLDLTRLEAGAWPLHLEAVDVAALAAGLVAQLSAPGGPLARHRVVLRSSTTRLAWADDLQVGRVVENLLTNAAKFSPAGSRITVEIGQRAADGTAGTAGTGRSDQVVVRVGDQGPGIPAADAERVFERFFRATAGPAAPPEMTGQPAAGTPAGTGLGLAICRGIVEAHGGTIWVEPRDQRPGHRGATFAFMLPAAQESERPAASDQEVVPAVR